MFDKVVLSEADQAKVDTLYKTYDQKVALAAASIYKIETDYVRCAAYKLDVGSLVIDGTYDDEDAVRLYLVRAIGGMCISTYMSGLDFPTDVLVKAGAKCRGIPSACPDAVYF